MNLFAVLAIISWIVLGPIGLHYIRKRMYKIDEMSLLDVLLGILFSPVFLIFIIFIWLDDVVIW